MSNKLSIFARFWTWLTGEVKALPAIEDTIINFVDKVTDDIKVIEGSKLPGYLESLATVAETFDPALTPFIAGIEFYIPKAIGLITGVLDNVEAAVKRLQAIKLEDEVIYAGNLGTLQAGMSHFILSNNAVTTGVLSPPPGQLLAIGQVVHSANAIPAAKVEAPAQDPDEQKADPDMDISKEAAENLAAGGGTQEEHKAPEPEQKDESTLDDVEQHLSYDELMAKQKEQDGSQA